MCRKDTRVGGYLTVWLALCLTLVMSLFLVLIDGVRRNGMRLEAECAVESSMQSIMAEYHRELFQKYNIFAIDSSYGTELCSKSNTEQHLKKYLEKNISAEDVFLSGFLYRDFFAMELEKAELTKIMFLTDGGGAVFRSAAVQALEADVGLELLEELQKWIQVIEVNGLERDNLEQEKQELDEQIEGYDGMMIELEKDDWVRFEVVNPTRKLEEKKKQGILKLVLKDTAGLSENVLQTDMLAGSRMERGEISTGNAEIKEISPQEELLERFLFQEYLLKYMQNFCTPEGQTDSLQYQVEYLVTGKEGDIENLKSTVGRICAIREAANFLYLLEDNEKRTAVQELSELACSLLLVPELAPLLEMTILLGWAFGESIYDVRSLLQGGRIPLMKSEESWHYGLSSALWGELEEETGEGEGLSYQDYLRIFMVFTGLDVLTVRAMNLMEADIRTTPGNQNFRLDGCYVMVEAFISLKSGYGYECELTRQRSY